MNAFLSQAGDAWCRLMHPAPRWPVCGYYECPACLRRYPVPWANRSLYGPATSVMPLPSATIGVRHAHSW